MKIIRNKLPDSDIGSRFDEESKNYLNAAKKAVDDKFESNEELNERDLVKTAKTAAGNKVLLHEIPVTAGKALGTMGIVYGLSKVPYEELGEKFKNIKSSFKEGGKELISFYKRHPKSSIVITTGIGTLAYNYPKIKKKYKDSRLAAEINTKSRIGKYRSSENIEK